MEIEDAGDTPERLAAEIHRQLGLIDGAVPIEAVAKALDIIEIRREPLRNFEAALMAGPERSDGAILVNSRSNLTRQRFGIAHELGHFLIPRHATTQGGSFACTQQDMIVSKSIDRVQEAEANRFAIELLAPQALLKPFLRGLPDLDKAIGIADRLDISRQAAARRYVELHDGRLAAVISRDRKVIYFEMREGFPALAFRSGDALPAAYGTTVPRGLTSMDTVDPRDWLLRPNDIELGAQTLWQAGGYSITLLHAEAPDFDE